MKDGVLAVNEQGGSIESDSDGESVNLGNELLEAAQEGDVEVVNELLAEGVDADWEYGTYYEPEEHTTALHFATAAGHLEVMEVLFEYGADVHKRYGDTPLHYAVRSSSLDTVPLLLAHGADVNARNEWARRLFISYITRMVSSWLLNFSTSIAVLLQHGADPEAASDDSSTPLYMAACNRNLPAVETLLAHGANVNRANERGLTAVLGAARDGDLETLRTLLEYGADVERSEPTLQDAERSGAVDKIRLLAKYLSP